MATAVQRRLQRSTLGIDFGDRHEGTGFFVQPEWIATCNHVISGHKKIADFRAGGLEIKDVRSDSTNDIAFLRVDPADEPVFVILDEGPNVQDGETLYGWVYWKAARQGEPIFLDFAGQRKEPLSLRIIGDQLVAGMSGSPLICQRTGKVCGMIDASRGERTRLGGIAVPSNILISSAQRLLPSFSIPNSDKTKWSDAVRESSAVFRRGLGRWDETVKPGHFRIFPREPIDIHSAYVEPIYARHRLELVDDSRVELPASTGFLEDCKSTLVRDRLLILQGGYGSGKSFLAKYIQRSLIENGQDSIFLSARDFVNFGSTETFLDSLDKRLVQESLTLFVDAFDDVMSTDPQRTEDIKRLLRIFAKVVANRSYALVLNFRPIPELPKSIIEQLAAQLAEEDVFQVDYFDLAPFTKVQVEKWLAAYTGARPDLGSIPLSIDQIEQSHKNLSVACRTPLFLYCLASSNKSAHGGRLPDVHTIYENFVNKTIKGKFRKAAASLDQFCKDYRVFLRQVACKIDDTHELLVTEEHVQHWFLDDSRHRYGIGSAKISDIVELAADQILKVPDRKDSRFIGTLLSCYFFQEYERGWSFRDNNILYFLLAEATFNGLSEVATARDNPESLASAFETLCASRHICLHPLAVELLFLKMEIEGFGTQISETIHRLLEADVFAISGQAAVEKLSYGQLKAVILLLLTYMHFHEVHLTQWPGFFDVLSLYLTIIRRIDRRAYDCARRFVRGINIKGDGAEVCMFDASGFNFTGARFSNVRFTRCTFKDAIMRDTRFEDVRFRLGEFVGMSFAQIGGTLRFENCWLHKVVITPEQATKLELLHSYIQELTITNGAKHDITVKCVGCDIDRFLYRNAPCGSLELINSVHSPLLLEGAKGNGIKLRRTLSVCKSPNARPYQANNGDNIKEV